MQSTVTVVWLALLLLGVVCPAPVQGLHDRYALHTPPAPFLADYGTKPVGGGG